MSRFDRLLLIATAGLILKYFYFGELIYFVYPKYNWLIVASALLLLVVAFVKNRQCCAHPTIKFHQFILIIPLMAGFLVSPQPLSANTALSRGLTQSLDLPSQAQFTVFDYFSTSPANRSIIDWVRLFTFNPEPTTYLDQPVQVSGFLLNHTSELKYISRFILSCCAADARPIVLPILTSPDLEALPEGQWINLNGTMQIYQSEQEGRIPVIQIDSFQKINPPKNPYEYQ